MAHTSCVQFLKICWWGFLYCNHSTTQKMSMFTWSMWVKQMIIFRTILVFNQLETSYDNTCSSMTTGFFSPKICIYCSWAKLNSDITGCSNTWKLEMSSINLTINSHRNHNVQAFCASLSQLDSMKKCSLLGNKIWGMIRKLATNLAPITDFSKNYSKPVVEAAFDEMSMVAVRALCENSLLVSLQNHSDLSIISLDDALKLLCQKKSAVLA